jgi:hypothetical protein
MCSGLAASSVLEAGGEVSVSPRDWAYRRANLVKHLGRACGYLGRFVGTYL